MILRFLNTLLLLTWTFFLVWLLVFANNDLIRLLHPRLWWILYVAVFVLMLFLISMVVPRRRAEKKASLSLEIIGILILLIPLLYFFKAKEARLDGTSLHNRIIQNDNGIVLNNLPDLTIFDESNSGAMTFSTILREPEKYQNQDVEVVCQSFVNDKLPPHTAMCYRYVITCCAADALPAFIFLSHQPQLEIENDRWVKINGPLSIISREGMEFPSVTVDRIEYVKEPAFPWAM